MIWPFRKPTPSEAARTLGKLGAEARKREAKKRYLAFHRKMRAERTNLPPSPWLEDR